MATDERFAELGRPGNIWAVASIQGEVERLIALHDALLEKVRPGDRIVYLGNYGGRGGSVVSVIDELLVFRRLFLTIPGMMPDDIVYLRGSLEEMWQKLLQIQFAPDPRDVYDWMVRQGLGAILEGYGVDTRDGYVATRDGAMTMTRWTNRLRGILRQRAGHEKFMSTLRRAAFTARHQDGAVLFVHSGLDPNRPIGAQKDSFWWDHAGFERLNGSYEGFTRVVRGSDPEKNGLKLDKIGVTLDGGAGFNGPLVAACVQSNGNLTELIEV